MKTRILSAIVLVAVLVVVLLMLPAWGTGVLFGAAAAMAAYELMFQTRLAQATRPVLYAMAMAFLVSVWSLWQDGNVARIGIFVYSLVLFGELIYSHEKLSSGQIFTAFVAGLLVPYLLTSLVRIRAMYSDIAAGNTTLGQFYVVVPFILAFSADTGAYFAGRFFGKHKLAPVVSPKKTVEGAVGGVLFTMLTMSLYGMLLQYVFHFHVEYLYGIVYALLGSVVSILGDLTFSAIKRQVGIKDYSNLIPGHGGILDRFDSMVLVAPLTEMLLAMLTFAVPTGGLG